MLAVVNAGAPAPRLDVPRGFTASVYVRGIHGARDLGLRSDGTLTLSGGDRRFEISPPTADAPLTVMVVAPELDTPQSVDNAALAVQAPAFVRLRWNAASSELGYVVAPDAGSRLRVPPQSLALARTLERRHADVAVAPDGTLYVADPRTGAVWRVRRSAL